MNQNSWIRFPCGRNFLYSSVFQNKNTLPNVTPHQDELLTKTMKLLTKTMKHIQFSCSLIFWVVWKQKAKPNGVMKRIVIAQEHPANPIELEWGLRAMVQENHLYEVTEGSTQKKVRIQIEALWPHPNTRFSSFKIPLFQRRYKNDSVACIDVLKTQPERNLNLLKRSWSIPNLQACKSGIGSWTRARNNHLNTSPFCLASLQHLPVLSFSAIQLCSVCGIIWTKARWKKEDDYHICNLFISFEPSTTSFFMYGMATQMLSKEKCKYVSQWDNSFHKSGTLFNNNKPSHSWWQDIRSVNLH